MKVSKCFISNRFRIFVKLLSKLPMCQCPCFICLVVEAINHSIPISTTLILFLQNIFASCNENLSIFKHEYETTFCLVNWLTKCGLMTIDANSFSLCTTRVTVPMYCKQLFCGGHWLTSSPLYNSLNLQAQCTNNNCDLSPLADNSDSQ